MYIVWLFFVVILLVAVIVLGLFSTFQMSSIQNVLASPDLVQQLSAQINKKNLTIVSVSKPMSYNCDIYQYILQTSLFQTVYLNTLLHYL